jgi:hypothetical protein
MKRAGFQLHSERGWIRTTLAPVNDKHEARFGVIDVVMFLALILGTVGIARLLIAH